MLAMRTDVAVRCLGDGGGRIRICRRRRDKSVRESRNPTRGRLSLGRDAAARCIVMVGGQRSKNKCRRLQSAATSRVAIIMSNGIEPSH